MDEKRLGDIIDDHCVKCRRVTNHSIVSLVDGEAAKVRCRTCYHDHDYRHEQAPPTKKELKKMEADALAAAAAAEKADPNDLRDGDQAHENDSKVSTKAEGPQAVVDKTSTNPPRSRSLKSRRA